MSVWHRLPIRKEEDHSHVRFVGNSKFAGMLKGEKSLLLLEFLSTKIHIPEYGLGIAIFLFCNASNLISTILES